MKDILKIFIVEENRETAELLKKVLTQLDHLHFSIVASSKRSFISKAQWVRPDMVIFGASPGILDRVSILRLRHAFPEVPLIIIEQDLTLHLKFPNALTDEVDNQIFTGKVEELLTLLRAIIIIDDPRSKMRGELENEERRQQVREQKSAEQSQRKAK